MKSYDDIYGAVYDYVYNVIDYPIYNLLRDERVSPEEVASNVDGYEMDWYDPKKRTTDSFDSPYPMLSENKIITYMAQLITDKLCSGILLSR